MSEHPEEAIRAMIFAAFADVVSPTRVDDMLAEPFRRNEVARAMAAAFMGKPWSEIPRIELFRHRESLFALSPAAYRAYVPAYLVATLAPDDPSNTHGADIRGYLLYSLDTDASSLIRVETTHARIAALDPAQRAAVAAVLHYLHVHWRMHDAALVLRGWR